MKTLLHTIGGLLALGAVLVIQSCSRTDSQANAESTPVDIPAQVSNNGQEIVFSPLSLQLQQITTDTVRSQELHLGFMAPAHVAVSIVRSEMSSSNLYLFETQDLTQLYSDFVKSSSALNRSSKQFERVRDLQAHKAVAEKELQDAEHDYTQARAELAEKESRLRAAGIDPKILEKTPAGSVWIIADIPEDQLRFVRRDVGCEVVCNSFPDEKWEGRVLSIGEVIDPTTRTVKVNLLLQNRNGKLRPGMFGTVSFSGSQERVLTIPRSAVVNLEGKTYVFKHVGNSFRRTEIQIGTETHDQYIVTQGIKRGDVIASAGVILLKQLSFGY